jgi:hypothetical protein
VAEQVAKVDPNLVLHDANGRVYTVRYEAVNAMLLNEFLKEHQRVEELESAVKELKNQMSQVSGHKSSPTKRITKNK